MVSFGSFLFSKVFPLKGKGLKYSVKMLHLIICVARTGYLINTVAKCVLMLPQTGFARDCCSFTSRKLKVGFSDTFCAVKVTLLK